jgi:hypothetical protein
VVEVEAAHTTVLVLYLDQFHTQPRLVLDLLRL